MDHPLEPMLEGAPQSAVRVVIYEDLQCGDCAWLRRKLDSQLLPAYGQRVAFEHHDFPLPKHSWARAAAVAAKHFQTIGTELAVAFRREILADLAQVTETAFPVWVRAFAKRHTLDPDAAQAALSDKVLHEAVDADYQAGLALGVVKTPTVYLGEKVFVEWVPMEELTAQLDVALAGDGGVR